LYFSVIYAGIIGAAVVFVVRVVADLILLCVCARLGTQWIRVLLPPMLFLFTAMIHSLSTSFSSRAMTVTTILILCVFTGWAFPRIASTKRLLASLNRNASKT
jgi:hypothetical protein